MTLSNCSEFIPVIAGEGAIFHVAVRYLTFPVNKLHFLRL